MSKTWEPLLERWISAGVLDAAVAERIREWEGEHAPSQGLRWPIRIALAFGAILLCAGVLLFVSAHWDQLSAAQRMSLIVATIAALHVGGAASAARFEALSIALHTVGTVALGAGIALAGQIFNLSDHWPTAVLLWAVGAALAWVFLRHWTQATLVAILFPYWLAGEWWSRMSDDHTLFLLPISIGVCALSFTYLSARRGPDDSTLRKALGWVGGLALLPAAFAISVESWNHVPSWRLQVIAWAIAVIGPLALAIALRRRDAIWTGVAILWSLLLAAMSGGRGGGIPVYLWCAVGASGLAFWGMRDSRPERINLGILGFALTVLIFYFSNVMDKLGRSASLIAIGMLFLGGGWLLEQTRRRLMAHIQQETI